MGNPDEYVTNVAIDHSYRLFTWYMQVIPAFRFREGRKLDDIELPICDQRKIKYPSVPPTAP